ncbi:MAG: adenylylsulfate kinase [Parcubacteria group bacterium Athens1014_26]|nr:MAG: adenylylsulfate kinase [Parcubacteria group bacterium Athens1014_26]
MKKMGKVIWFTGLSGSGKTTIASAFCERLNSCGKKVFILDGDEIRSKLHKHLSFSREDIKENNHLIAMMAKEKISEFDFILVPIISPYRDDRQAARNLLGENFIELFVDTSLKECIKRDVKGLYKKALNKEIANFIGVSDSNPYEFPRVPDIHLNTENLSIDECVSIILEYL